MNIFLNSYKKIFSISEIENSTVLKFVFGAQIFTFFIYFSSLISSSGTSISSALGGYNTCPPYFQSCSFLNFLEPLPYGYTQSIFYMIFFALIFLIIYLLFKNKILYAHLLTMPLFLWKFILTFFISYNYVANYEYYHLIFLIILLFLPYKIFFLQLSIPLCYFLSTLSKVHESWILGTYFSSLKLGLPLFPKITIPLLTNALIFIEMIASWYLMSKNKILQRGTLAFFIFFHLYSGILVYFRYPATVLPLILILFGPLYKKQEVPLNKKAIFSWVFIAFLVFCQISPKLIKGDEKLTLEGNTYGFYMFESNHQCISNWYVSVNDQIQEDNFKRSYQNPRNRCNPYREFSSIKNYCRINPEVTNVRWTFDHSINGNPFLRIVDEKNICHSGLKYYPFKHNSWIKLKEENPEIIGYPVQNYYY